MEPDRKKNNKCLVLFDQKGFLLYHLNEKIQPSGEGVWFIT